MNEYIKSLLESSAWEDIEANFLNEVKQLRDPSDIPNNLRNDVYCREVRARVIAAQKLESFIARIKLAGSGPSKITKKNYR